MKPPPTTHLEPAGEFANWPQEGLSPTEHYARQAAFWYEWSADARDEHGAAMFRHVAEVMECASKNPTLRRLYAFTSHCEVNFLWGNDPLPLAIQCKPRLTWETCDANYVVSSRYCWAIDEDDERSAKVVRTLLEKTWPNWRGAPLDGPSYREADTAEDAVELLVSMLPPEMIYDSDTVS